MPPALCLPISWQTPGNGPFLTVFMGEVTSGQEIKKRRWVQHWPVVILTELVCCKSRDQLRSLLTLNWGFSLPFFLFFSVLIDHSFFLSKSQPTKDICERIFCSNPGIKKLCDTQLYACMWFPPFRRPLWLLSHLHAQTYIAFDLVTRCDLAH